MLQWPDKPADECGVEAATAIASLAKIKRATSEAESPGCGVSDGEHASCEVNNPHTAH